MAIDKKCVVEFNGKEIDPSRIDNPRLRAVFQERVHDGEKFLFRYGDHTDGQIGGSDYSDYSDRYSDGHYDHKDHHEDGVWGRGSHREIHRDKYRDRGK